MLLVAIPLIIVSFALCGAAGKDALANQRTQQPVAPAFRDMPHALPPLAPRCFAAGTDQAAAIAAILRRPPQPALNAKLAIHLLRVYPHAVVPSSGLSAGGDVLRSLTGHPPASQHVTESALVLTRHGARYRPSRPDEPTASWRENHRDIFLATFAERGLSLSTPLRVDEATTADLSALLRDAVATFDPKQDEIEWSAIAFAIYLSDQKSWRDCDGNVCTFDQLAETLGQRDLSRCSCGGAHVLLAMTYLLRVDSDAQLLSESTRQMLRTRISTAVQTVVQTQSPDGSWTSPWASQGAEDTITALNHVRLLTTGHLLEWLQYVPSDMQPDVTVYARAGEWLIKHLQQLQHSPTFNSSAWICPWSHAACALRNLCGAGGT